MNDRNPCFMFRRFQVHGLTHRLTTMTDISLCYPVLSTNNKYPSRSRLLSYIILHSTVHLTFYPFLYWYQLDTQFFYINYIKLGSSTCFEHHPLIFRRSMMLIAHVCCLWYSHSVKVAIWFNKTCRIKQLTLETCRGT